MRVLRATLFALFVATLALPWAPLYAQVASEQSTIVTARIVGEITTGTARYFARAHREATERNAELFLVYLDTPGGLIKATHDMVALLLDSEVPTAVYVHKAGGFAFSAGTYLLLAAEHAAVHPNASIGAAQPVAFGTEETEPCEKTVNAMEAFIRSIADARNRDAAIAARFVTENLTLTGTEAFEAGIIDSMPTDVNILYDAFGVGEPAIVAVEPSLFERAIAIVSLPMIAGLLLTMASLGIIFSVRSGEFELLLFFVPLLFVALWALGTLELSTVGVVIFASALALIAFEIMTPGLGFPGIAGALLLITSLFVLADEPFFTLRMHGTLLYAALTLLITMLALFFWISFGAVRALRLPPQTGIESLPGREGIAATDITRDGGIITVDAYRWNAESSERIAAGTKVVVERVEKNICVVRRTP